MENKLIMTRQEGHLLFVAVEGAIKDWACYYGPTSKGADWVRSWGDKISESKARKLFPEFNHLRWRP